MWNTDVPSPSNKAPAVSNTIWMEIFLKGKQGNECSSTRKSRMKPHWPDLAIEVGLGLGTNSCSWHICFSIQRGLSNWPLCQILYSSHLLIVSHAYCVLVSSIVNDYMNWIMGTTIFETGSAFGGSASGSCEASWDIIWVLTVTGSECYSKCLTIYCNGKDPYRPWAYKSKITEV